MTQKRHCGPYGVSKPAAVNICTARAAAYLNHAFGTDKYPRSDDTANDDGNPTNEANLRLKCHHLEAVVELTSRHIVYLGRAASGAIFAVRLLGDVNGRHQARVFRLSAFTTTTFSNKSIKTVAPARVLNICRKYPNKMPAVK